MKINPNFIVTKHQVHLVEMFSLSSGNVQKKYKTSLTSFLGLFASTVSMRKNLAQDIAETIYLE